MASSLSVDQISEPRRNLAGFDPYWDAIASYSQVGLGLGLGGRPTTRSSNATDSCGIVAWYIECFIDRAR